MIENRSNDGVILHIPFERILLQFALHYHKLKSQVKKGIMSYQRRFPSIGISCSDLLVSLIQKCKKTSH